MRHYTYGAISLGCITQNTYGHDIIDDRSVVIHVYLIKPRHVCYNGYNAYNHSDAETLLELMPTIVNWARRNQRQGNYIESPTFPLKLMKGPSAKWNTFFTHKYHQVWHKVNRADFVWYICFNFSTRKWSSAKKTYQQYRILRITLRYDDTRSFQGVINTASQRAIVPLSAPLQIDPGWNFLY